MTNKKINKFVYGIFIISYLFDPTGKVFNLKLPSLFLLLGWCLIDGKSISIRNLQYVIVLYLVLFFSTLNMLLNGYEYNPALFFSYFKTFITLFVCIFITNGEYLYKPFKFMCIFLSFLTIVVSIIIIFFPLFAYVFDMPPFNTIFKIQQRAILGRMYSQAFHLSSPIIMIQFGPTFGNFLKEKKKKDLFLTILYGIALFFSGTRANMLAGVLIICLVFLYFEFKQKGRMYLVSILSVIFIFFGFMLIFLLLTDKSSGSLGVKERHIKSTFDLLCNNNIFLFGNGPATEFYTEGFHRYTNITELSYLDLLRLFGLFGTIGIIFVYWYPLIPIFYSNKFENFSFGISYLAYLFIAGTNPLLIVPQGFIAFILAYSFLNDNVCNCNLGENIHLKRIKLI